MELGFECPEVYGDPAILLPDVHMPRCGIEPVALGIVPHFKDLAAVSAQYPKDEQSRVIDVTNPVEDVVDHIASCERIASSSLHGLIVAQAYGVRAGWVEFSDNLDGDGVKFLDYLASGSVFLSESKGPLDARDPLSIEELMAFVDEFPQPDLAPLRRPLLAACPFHATC